MTPTLEYIESYFQGELPEQEQKAFEQRCEQDTAFAEEVAFYVSSRQAIRQLLLDQKKQTWEPEAIKEEKIPFIPLARTSFIQKWLPYTAAACLLLVIGTVFFENSISPHQLADAYIQKEVVYIHPLMGSGEDSLQRAIGDYNNKQYDKALPVFEALAGNHPEIVDARKYAGFVYLLKQEYDKALESFDKLANIQPLHSNPGLFYKAVTLLERNKEADKEKAKELLQLVVKNKQAGAQQAEKWLQQWK